MNPSLQGPLKPPGRTIMFGLLLAAVLFAAACGADSSTNVVPAQQTTQDPDRAEQQAVLEESNLVITSTPQDRGVLDGPVIYSVAGDGDANDASETRHDGSDRAAQPSETEDPEDGGSTEPIEPRCEFEFLTEDLSSNRGNALSPGRLQVVVFYDGDPSSSPELRIGLGDKDIVIGEERAGGPIETFGRAIETREYQISGCEPTGTFSVSGVVPNGVIDGLAFAMMWRDEGGRYSMIKSNTLSSSGATYVGMWPLGFSRDTFTEVTPHISDPFGRETARGLITGSALMPNGTHTFNLPAAD